MGNRALFLLIAALSIITIFTFNGMNASDDLKFSSSEDPIEMADELSDKSIIAAAARKGSPQNQPQSQETNTINPGATHKHPRHPASYSESNDTIAQKSPEARELKTFSIALEDRNWKIWEGVTAVPEHKFLNRGQDLAGRLSGYVLVKGEHGLSLDDFKTVNPIVVYNERRQIPGVVTGILSVKITQGVNVNSILNSYQLVSRDAFPQIGLYYVTSRNQPFNLPELFKSLQKDPLIERVDVEILDRQYEGR